MNDLRPAHQLAGDREAGAACPLCGVIVRLGEPVLVCRTCGTVHHQPCWEQAGQCGSYICSPARKTLSQGTEPALKISTTDLERASPLPARRPAFTTFAGPVGPEPSRTNGLAIASLITAVAGILLFGAVTGLAAILLGSLALGAIRGTRQKGTGLAVVGVLLGLVDVVGWLVVLYLVFSGGMVHLKAVDFRPDLTALQDLDPKISRAMRANVLIEGRGGALGLGQTIGSGVILKIENDEALILTNRHVVDPKFAGEAPEEGAGMLPKGQLEVQMVDQTSQPGQVAWIAPAGIDLALVRVSSPGREAQAAKWKMGRKLPRVGAPAFAIGNPHGLGWTHTDGTISQLRLQRLGGHQLHIIQTQIAINAGNSGGGLYDQEGYLFGIATWTQDKRVAEGLSFAIAVDTLRETPPPGLDLQAGSE